MIVIDTNIIISAIIKNKLTRRIIIQGNLELIAPSYILSEIYEHKEEILNKAKIDEKYFETIILLLFKYIRIIHRSVYAEYLERSKNLIKDKEDIPFIATALAFNCPIWSDDKHFKEQSIIKIYTTKEMIKLV